MAAVEFNNSVLKTAYGPSVKAYYRMESGALTTDSSGNSFTLTNNNSVADGTGKFGGAADFGTANTNKRLEILNNLGIDGGRITVSGWFKMNTEIGAGGYGALFGQGSATTKTLYEVYYTFDGGNRRLVFLRLGSALRQFTYDITLGTSVYHHVALTYDGTTVRGYVNGVEAGNITASGNSGSAIINSFVIAARNETGTADLYASLTADDVVVFNEALTADQIKDLYEGRMPGELWPSYFANSKGLWHMNGGSTDSSGNGFNGTDTSMTYPQGKFNQCAAFSGSGYITLGNVNNFERTDSFSVMMWFKHGVGSQGAMVHKQKNTSVFNGWYVTKFNTPLIRIGMTGSDGTALYGDTAQGWEDNTWHHLAMLYDGSQTAAGLKCMVDGGVVPLTYTNTLATNIANAFNLIFGAREVSGFPYTGSLDEVVINSPSLSTSSVTNYYAWATGKRTQMF